MKTSKQTILLFATCFAFCVSLQAQQTEIEHTSTGTSPQLLLTEASTSYGRLTMKNKEKGEWTLAARNGPGTNDDDFNIYFDDLGGNVGNVINIDGDNRRTTYESDIKINNHLTEPIMTFDVEDKNSAYINFEANGGSGIGGYFKYFAQQGGTAVPSYFEIKAPGGNNYLSMFGGSSSTFGPGELGSGAGGGGRLRVVHNSTSDSPTLRLIEEGTSDFVRLFFTNQSVPANRFNIAANPGSSSPRLDLGFNGSAVLSVDGDDERIGIEDTTPEYTLSVDHASGSPSAGSDHGFNIENSSNSDSWTFYTRTSTGDLQIFHDPNTQDILNPILRGTFDSGNGAYTNNSDIRLKKNITTLDSQLDKVMQLRPTRYQFKNVDPDNQEYSLGLIAQEVQKVIPEVVSQITSIEEHGTDHLGISYSELIPVLIRAIQDQQDIITDLQKEMASQKILIKKMASNN